MSEARVSPLYMSMMPGISGAHALWAITIAGCMLHGCDRQEPIRAYRTPKDAMTAQATPVRASTPSPTEERLIWTLPAGWVEQPGDGGMRFATLIDEQNKPAVVVTVTKLSSQAGSLLANVNRWLGQLGLPEVQQQDLASLTRPVPGDNLNGTVVDLTGTGPSDAPQRMIAAVFERPNATWFFKAIEANSVIEAAEPELLELFQSIRVQSFPTAPISEPDQNVSTVSKPLSFTVPDGWREDPSPRPARITTLVIESQPQAELAVTRFPGTVGGELANLNRWRGQLGLPPVAMLAGQDGQDITISGKAGRLYHLKSADDAGRLAMSVAFAEHEGQSWFFKLTGSATAVAAEGERFHQFLDSVRFNDSSEESG